MGDKFTSRVGVLIRNFRIAAELTQKELMNQLEMILLDEGDSIIMISLVSP